MSTRRQIVVDNATLSGVERLTGVSKIMNLSNTDNDILCLEKLITAILFSDELIGIDDYKEQFRSDRLKNFSYVSFKRLDDSTYSKLTTDAGEFAKGMLFSFEGSQPAGDVVSFFQALRLHPQLRWDIFGSSEYLTLSLLVDDPNVLQYETALDAAFRNENTDREMVPDELASSAGFSVAGHPEIEDLKDFVRAIASNNPRYSGPGHKDILNRVVFGYGWAAERTHFYNSFAAMHNADAFLSPLRDAFCESLCRLNAPSQVESLLNRLKNSSQEALSSIVEPSGNSHFAMRLPFFSAYYISISDNPKQSIERALEDRNKSDFQDARDVFHNLGHLSQQDKYKEVNFIFRHLEQTCQRLMRKYAVSTSNGLQFSLSLGISGVGVSISTKFDQIFRHYRFNPFSRIFRNIAVDMLNVEKLGELHEKLCSSQMKHQKASYSRVSATPRFMENRGSEYGRPAKL